MQRRYKITEHPEIVIIMQRSISLFENKTTMSKSSFRVIIFVDITLNFELDIERDAIRKLLLIKQEAEESELTICSVLPFPSIVE